jgi:hypothetical protein
VGILTVSIAFAVSFAALKDYYCRQQQLIVDLKKKACGSAFRIEGQVGISVEHVA